MERNEAIEVIKRNYPHVTKSGSQFETALRLLIPELKESEDERMKNAAIRACKYMIDNFENSTKDYEDAVAWLEKQKTSEEALQYLRENHSSSEMSDFQAAMNIAVAKAYDKGYNDGFKKGEKKSIDDLTQQETMDIAVSKCFEQGEQKPVEPEFVWEDKLGERLKREKEMQKHAWSEDDENHIQHISDFIMRNRVGDTDAIYRLEQDVDWLKSLKDRVQPQQEWGEEDKKMLESCCCAISAADYYTYDDKQEMERWLKSLRPQNT